MFFSLGRKLKFSEQAVNITFRLPVSLVEKIDLESDKSMLAYLLFSKYYREIEKDSKK